MHTAPLAKISTRPFLRLMRLLSRRATLWTEMIHCSALSRAPIVAGRFVEVNLNCGCPAASAGAGAHGAFLLRREERERLGMLCRALREGVARGVRVSLKLRTGVAGEATLEDLERTMRMASECGVEHLVLHAREAVLGLTPKENRKIPPLQREWAREMRTRLPELTMTFNGEVTSWAAASELRGEGFDGVMLGRKIIEEPFFMAHSDHLMMGEPENKLTREDIAFKYAEWLEQERTVSTRAEAFDLAPVVNLFVGTEWNKMWKRNLLDKDEYRDPIVRILKTLDRMKRN